MIGALSAIITLTFETIIPAKKDINNDKAKPIPDLISIFALLLEPISVPKDTPQREPIPVINSSSARFSEKSTPNILLKIIIVTIDIRKFKINPTHIEASKLTFLFTGDIAFLFATVDKFASYWWIISSPQE